MGVPSNSNRTSLNSALRFELTFILATPLVDRLSANCPPQSSAPNSIGSGPGSSRRVPNQGWIGVAGGPVRLVGLENSRPDLPLARPQQPVKDTLHALEIIPRWCVRVQQLERPVEQRRGVWRLPRKRSAGLCPPQVPAPSRCQACTSSRIRVSLSGPVPARRIRWFMAMVRLFSEYIPCRPIASFSSFKGFHSA